MFDIGIVFDLAREEKLVRDSSRWAARAAAEVDLGPIRAAIEERGETVEAFVRRVAPEYFERLVRP